MISPVFSDNYVDANLVTGGVKKHLRVFESIRKFCELSKIRRCFLLIFAVLLFDMKIAQVLPDILLTADVNILQILIDEKICFRKCLFCFAPGGNAVCHIWAGYTDRRNMN